MPAGMEVPRHWQEVAPAGPLAGAASIDLGGAVLADPEHRARFAPADALAAVGHWRWRDVALFPGLALPFQDGRAIEEARYCVYGDEEQVAAAAVAAGGLRRLAGRRCFLGFNRVHSNHFHVTTQIVPAVAGYARDPGFRDGLLLLPEGATHLLRAFAAADIALPEIAWLAPRESVAIDDLTWSSVLAAGDRPNRLGADLFAALRRRCPPEPQTPGRIYVWRLDATARPLRNEDALVAMLAAHGVVPVVLGQLPIERQVALFRGALVVVGAHGAGLCNVAFCEPGALLYELFPSHYVNPCMLRLAELQGLHYACDIFPSQPEPGQWRHSVAWTVDVDAVERRLCHLLVRPEIGTAETAHGIESAAASL